MTWLILSFLGLPACSTESAVTTAPPLDPASWTFPAEADRTRYEAVRSDLAARWPAGGHEPLRRGGNFLRERWCAAQGCPEGGEQATLSVLHTPPAYPEVFGLVVDVVAVRDDVRVSLHVSRGGRSISGDAVTVEVQTPEGALTLGSALAWSVGEHRMTAPAIDLAALTTSVDSLTAAVDGQLADLAAQVHAHLGSGEAWRCVYGEAPGNGAPPPCAPTPLTEAELTAERERLLAWLAEARTLLSSRAPTIHEALRAAVPNGL